MIRLVLAISIAVSFLAGCTAAAPSTAPTEGSASTPAEAATQGATQTPAPAATAVPADIGAARQLPTADSLEPGRYLLDFGGYRFTFTVADPGWSADVSAGGVYRGDDRELAIFWPGGEVSSLYRDPCESSGTEFEPGPSVDELAGALASLEGFEATAPADVTVSGYHGKRIAITVPTDVDLGSPGCDNGNYSLSEGRWFQAPGQTDDMRILDLDGERQTVTTSTTPATPTDVSSQLDDMVESLLIEQH